MSGRIPDKPEEEIVALSKRIKPVVSVNGEKRYIRPVDLFSIAYTWDPKPAKQARGLYPYRDITTYHRWGYYGFFKPSIAEVLAQIPEACVDETVAFEIIKRPETSEDLQAQWDIVNEGYHMATTRLYSRTENENWDRLNEEPDWKEVGF